MRPTIRPGLRLLRRDAHTLQLGLDWPGLCLVRDTPVVRAVLDAVDGFRAADAVVLAAAAQGHQREACAEALAALMRCGAVVDGNRPRDPDVPSSAWAAWSLLAGPQREASDVASSRRRRRVAVCGDGVVADRVRGLLPGSQVRVAADRTAADLVVMAVDDEPDRQSSDELMGLGVPHLWASLRDLVGVVGPFVLPGRTGCLRCADEARGDRDPGWPTLLAAATAKPIATPATDDVLAALVAAWAVHEVAVWASDLPPQTWNHLVEIPYGSSPVERVAVDPHPRCGCGWFRRQDTMGA